MINYKTLSLANQVYDIIEKKILNGAYETGEIISESRLSEELGVSRTPIREAMARLEAEKLIGITPCGTIVQGITDKDVKDLFKVKGFLEPMTAGMAAANISERELGKLKNILDQQEFYSEKGNTESIRNLDTEFHDIIYLASGSPTFQSILSPIHHKLMKYREDSLNTSGRSRYSVEEHVHIYEALKNHDTELAEKLVNEHISHAYENIMKGTR